MRRQAHLSIFEQVMRHLLAALIALQLQVTWTCSANEFNQTLSSPLQTKSLPCLNPQQGQMKLKNRNYLVVDEVIEASETDGDGCTIISMNLKNNEHSSIASSQIMDLGKSSEIAPVTNFAIATVVGTTDVITVNPLVNVESMNILKESIFSNITLCTVQSCSSIAESNSHSQSDLTINTTTSGKRPFKNIEYKQINLNTSPLKQKRLNTLLATSSGFEDRNDPHRPSLSKLQAMSCNLFNASATEKDQNCQLSYSKTTTQCHSNAKNTIMCLPEANSIERLTTLKSTDYLHNATTPAQLIQSINNIKNLTVLQLQAWIEGVLQETDGAERLTQYCEALIYTEVQCLKRFITAASRHAIKLRKLYSHILQLSVQRHMPDTTECVFQVFLPDIPTLAKIMLHASQFLSNQEIKTLLAQLHTLSNSKFGNLITYMSITGGVEQQFTVISSILDALASMKVEQLFISVILLTLANTHCVEFASQYIQTFDSAPLKSQTADALLHFAFINNCAKCIADLERTMSPSVELMSRFEAMKFANPYCHIFAFDILRSSHDLSHIPLNLTIPTASIRMIGHNVMLAIDEDNEAQLWNIIYPDTATFSPQFVANIIQLCVVRAAHRCLTGIVRKTYPLAPGVVQSAAQWAFLQSIKLHTRMATGVCKKCGRQAIFWILTDLYNDSSMSLLVTDIVRGAVHELLESDNDCNASLLLVAMQYTLVESIIKAVWTDGTPLSISARSHLAALVTQLDATANDSQEGLQATEENDSYSLYTGEIDLCALFGDN